MPQHIFHSFLDSKYCTGDQQNDNVSSICKFNLERPIIKYILAYSALLEIHNAITIRKGWSIFARAV